MISYEWLRNWNSPQDSGTFLYAAQQHGKVRLVKCSWLQLTYLIDWHPQYCQGLQEGAQGHSQLFCWCACQAQTGTLHADQTQQVTAMLQSYNWC